MRREVITLIDDIDGVPADETVVFSLDGKHFTIDLAAEKATMLRLGLEEFVAAARRVKSAAPARRGAVRPSADREQRNAIRDWARAQGMKVGVRGRIPEDIRQQFAAAH